MTYTRLITLVTVSVVVQPLLAYAMAQQHALDAVVPGQMYVRLSAKAVPGTAGKTSLAVFEEEAAQYSVTGIRKAFPSLDIIAAKRPLSAAEAALRQVYSVQYDLSSSPREIAGALARIPGVVYAEPAGRYRLFSDRSTGPNAKLGDPDDSLYHQQDHLGRMQLPEAWDVIKGSAGNAVIATVDLGTRWRHEDLQANVWTNPDEIDGNGIDDDGNGFVDDMHGWNFQNGSPDPTLVPYTPAIWIEDDIAHGTAMAGVAAAVTDNGIGIAGASWNAEFMSLNVSCYHLEPGSYWRYLLYVCSPERGILYAAHNGASVILVDWGRTEPSKTLESSIQAALDNGALVVAAAGNSGMDLDGNPVYPASYATTLSVGGLEHDSDVNAYNYGRSVNVFAPGKDIEATDVSIAPTYIEGADNYVNTYSAKNGTSYAAALVAGVAALVKSNFPSFGPERIREQIRQTAVSIDGANPSRAGRMGSGKVSAYRAVTQPPRPALRVVEWGVWHAGDSTDYLTQNDSVVVTVTFENFHEGASYDVKADLLMRAGAVEWTSQEISLGFMEHAERHQATYTFVIPLEAPRGDVLIFPRIKMPGGGEDSPDVLRFYLRNSRLAERIHSTPNIMVSMTNGCTIGHTVWRGDPGSQGIGFRVRDPSGSGMRDVLYEGGLVLAIEAGTRHGAADCIRHDFYDFHRQEFWDTRKNFEFDIIDDMSLVDPGPPFSEMGTAKYRARCRKDNLHCPHAFKYKSLEMVQESFADAHSQNEDFVLVQYTIKNTGGFDIDNLYVGLFMDWDINDNKRDIVLFDSTRGIRYHMGDNLSNPTTVLGTRVLTAGTVPHHYQAIHSDTKHNFDENYVKRYELITGSSSNYYYNICSLHRCVGNYAQMAGAGPYSIAEDSSITVAFALVTGAGESDFLANADQALKFWKEDVVGVAVEGVERVPAGEWAVALPYPHPAILPVALQFKTAAPSVVQLEAFDLLGRRVWHANEIRVPGGQHSVTWNGHDVAPGLYLVRMTAHSGDQVYIRSRSVIVR